MISPVWSATTCDFPGAGVYIGHAPRPEHLVALRMISPRQMRLITGARTRLGPRGGEVGLEYYAVRDPSVVRVVPVDKPPVNGFRHVSLVFQIERPSLLADAVSLHPGIAPAASPPQASSPSACRSRGRTSSTAAPSWTDPRAPSPTSTVASRRWSTTRADPGRPHPRP